ncbi:MAG: urate hydroxylase PuuD [Proteobacteria bacterium]|nr:urate hydroxylase PuuD [Pseudomonadota bacterium]
MAAFLGNLRNTVVAGFVLAAIVLFIRLSMGNLDFATEAFWAFIIRWAHIICGVMWIGLLWYFNFVSTPTTPKIPEELRPALGRYITPEALFWFRWGAMGTIVFGIILAGMNHYLIQAFSLDMVNDPTGAFSTPSYLLIGLGMWMGTIMWFNVWFVIWPNQQRALNLNGKGEGLDAATKAASGKTAGMFSRINTLLSIPMLFCMAAASHMP